MTTAQILTAQSDFIDVSWDTDDPRLDEAAQDLFNMTTFKTPKQRKDAVANLQKHMRGVLIVAVRTYQLDPALPIVCPRNNNFGTDSYGGKFDPINPYAYNFKKIREVLDGLTDMGFLETYKRRLIVCILLHCQALYCRKLWWFCSEIVFLQSKTTSKTPEGLNLIYQHPPHFSPTPSRQAFFL